MPLNIRKVELGREIVNRNLVDWSWNDCFISFIAWRISFQLAYAIMGEASWSTVVEQGGAGACSREPNHHGPSTLLPAVQGGPLYRYSRRLCSCGSFLADRRKWLAVEMGEAWPAEGLAGQVCNSISRNVTCATSLRRRASADQTSVWSRSAYGELTRIVFTARSRRPSMPEIPSTRWPRSRLRPRALPGCAQRTTMSTPLSPEPDRAVE